MLSGQRKYLKPTTMYIPQPIHTNSASKLGKFKYDLHKGTIHLLQTLESGVFNQILRAHSGREPLHQRCQRRTEMLWEFSPAEMSHFSTINWGKTSAQNGRYRLVQSWKVDGLC